MFRVIWFQEVTSTLQSHSPIIPLPFFFISSNASFNLIKCLGSSSEGLLYVLQGGEFVAAAAWEGWTIPHNRNQWIVEDPPQGSDPVPAIVGASSCFATSYLLSSKSQCVNLYSEGFSPSFLDRVQPPILVADW